jgi:hypothetical protein
MPFDAPVTSASWPVRLQRLDDEETAIECGTEETGGKYRGIRIRYTPGYTRQEVACENGAAQPRVFAHCFTTSIKICANRGPKDWKACR